ncbi:unnamed protein product [Rotaria sp. Silwood1]|nr:unnamed protein product [Rotaria sp. Silwood1]CAF1605133.1 unnamed protein product [Rotaria sp. Silwood1]
MDELYYAEEFFRIFYEENSRDYNIHDLNKMYNFFSYIYTKQGNYEKAMEYCQKVIDSEKYIEHDRDTLAATYNNMGELYNIKQDFVSAIANFTKAISIDSDNPDLLDVCYNNIGLVAAMQQDYSTALKMFEKAVKIVQLNFPSNHPSLGRLYINIATVYQAQGNMTMGIEMLKKSLEIHNGSRPPTHHDIGIANKILGDALHRNNQVFQSLKYKRRAEEIHLKSFLKPDNHHRPAVRISNYGAILHAEGKHKEALEEYEKALAMELVDHAPNDPSLEPLYYTMGMIHFKEKNFLRALQMLEKAIEIETTTDTNTNNHSLANTYTLMGMIYECQKKHKEAFQFLTKALEIKAQYLPPDHHDIQLYYEMIEVICQKL